MILAAVYPGFSFFRDINHERISYLDVLSMDEFYSHEYTRANQGDDNSHCRGIERHLADSLRFFSYQAAKDSSDNGADRTPNRRAQGRAAYQTYRAA